MLKQMHQRAAQRASTRATNTLASAAAMFAANVAITMLMAGGFMAGGSGHGGLMSCVHAGMFYVITFVLVAASVVLDLRARKQRRRLYRMLLCIDNR